MANLITNELKRRALAAWFAAADVRAILLMSNTTADTENDGIVNLDDYATLDECDDSGTSRITLAGEAVAKDDGNDRAEYDGNDLSFAGLSGDASRDYVGVLLYEHVDGTEANDLAGVFIEFENGPIPKESSQVDVPWDAEGILQLG